MVLLVVKPWFGITNNKSPVNESYSANVGVLSEPLFGFIELGNDLINLCT